MISGVLINQPSDLTNIKEGDQVKISVNEISDWMFAIGGRVYGAFSVQALRSKMNDSERADHDAAWGYEFGDFNDILVAYEQKEHPENLKDHPMSVNSANRLEEFLTQNPDAINGTDEFGYTMLHDEAIAGNLTLVNVLLANGANTNIKNTKWKNRRRTC